MKKDKGTFTFRRVTLDDIDVLIENRIVFLKEVKSISSFEHETLLRQNLKQYFQKSIIDDTFISWIAYYKNKPIGFSGIVFREQPGNIEIPNGKTAYILNMYTIKQFRKKGIASMLLQKLIEDAKLRNVIKIELHSTLAGEPVYKQFGFIEPDHKALELFVS